MYHKDGKKKLLTKIGIYSEKERGVNVIARGNCFNCAHHPSEKLMDICLGIVVGSAPAVAYTE